jgi:apolipoprotein N-acyltransferase
MTARDQIVRQWAYFEQAMTQLRAYVQRLSPIQQNGLGLLLGALLTLAFAPFHLWLLVVPVFTVLYWLLEGTPTRWRAAWLGWWFNMGNFCTGFAWIAVSFQYQANMPPSLGYLAVVLLSAYLAVYPAIAFALTRYLWHPGLVGLLWFAVFFTLAEMARGIFFTGFPWNIVGTLWTAVLPIAQMASLVGAEGLTALTVLAGSVFGLIMPGGRAGRWGSLLVALGVLLALTLGQWILEQTPVRLWPQVQLHLIQANIDQSIKWDEARARKILERHLAMSAQALSQSRALVPAGTTMLDVVIWPETAVPNVLEEEPETRALIARMLGPQGVLLTGGVRFDRDSQGNLIGARNSLLAIDAQGRIINTYDKAHLVPYGEYLPARSFLSALGLSRLAPGGFDFFAGPGPRTLEVFGLPAFSPQICYEVIFPGKVVDKSQRPAWLLNISNDAWFGRSHGPAQHFAQATMRGIEEGLPVVRVTPTGLTGVIDAQGRIREIIPQYTHGALSVQLMQPKETTTYARFGQGTTILLLIVLGGLALVVKQAQKHHNRSVK